MKKTPKVRIKEFVTKNSTPIALGFGYVIGVGLAIAMIKRSQANSTNTFFYAFVDNKDVPLFEPKFKELLQEFSIQYIKVD